MSKSVLSSVDEALRDYAEGRMVIVVDDEDRENEGDLVLAADFATPEAVNFMVTHGRGLVCLAMRGALLDRLKIPMMVPQSQNRSGFGTGFTLSVEAVDGVSTGISAHDRAHTIKTLIDPSTTTADIAFPGHIFPLRARDGGVRERRGQTEAAVDLSMLAGLTPAGVICEIMREDGEMMRLAELTEFASTHDIRIISVEQLVQHQSSVPNGEPTTTLLSSMRVANEHADNAGRELPLATLIGQSHLPTIHGDFSMLVFRDEQGFEHSALVKADNHVASTDTPPLVRLHSECLTGDAFGSLRCDCGEQLQEALAQINACGHGALLYLRQEGRGIGLGNKIRAYELQDQGQDTVDANLQLGFPADARRYDVAADILKQLNFQRLHLLTNNPAKQEALNRLGIAVEKRVPLIIRSQSHNENYLKTKASKLGHQFS